jgi:hypothetical protein
LAGLFRNISSANAAVVGSKWTFVRTPMSALCRFCCKKSAATDRAVPLRAATFDALALMHLRNFDATRHTEAGRVAVVRPALRAALGSERWRPEQSHAGPWATQLKPTEPQNALQVCEPHQGPVYSRREPNPHFMPRPTGPWAVNVALTAQSSLGARTPQLAARTRLDSLRGVHSRPP